MGLFGRKKKRRRRSGGQAAAQQVQPVQNQAPVRPNNKKRRRKRHKSNRILYYILVLFILTVVGVVLSLTVFFKITAINVKGVSKYPVAAVQQLTGISVGDNLFRVDLKTAKEKIKALPYVEDVAIKRSYPPEIVVEVTQAKPAAALEEDNGGYTLVSADGRILERDAQLPADLLPIVGAELKGTPGDYPAQAPKKATEEELAAAEEAAEIIRMTNYTLQALEESGLVLQKVDFSDRYNIQAQYSENIVIEFGSESELVRKMKLTREVIDNQLEADFRGVLYSGTVGKVWADPETNLPDISIPDHYVFDEKTGTYVDPAELEPEKTVQTALAEDENDDWEE
ncbi:MAG: FtsQ-type POTRA domain-containing protein [Oscillospiraceae bacterium]|nr:FtsQ-type POTRA domain-containing protein [Oscillospiraceae bacterium]